MAKHISKTVIEDIAYEIKSLGQIVHAYNTGTLPEDSNYADKDFTLDLANPEVVLDWLADNIHEVFATHDPSFNSNKFRQQIEYKVTN